MKTKEQQREYRTEYRERQQLKVAREIIAGKRDSRGNKIAPVQEADADIPANFTGSRMRDYRHQYFVAGQEVTREEYRAHVLGEEVE